METKIQVKHVNGLKSARAKISDMGDLSHELLFDVLLAPGDLERILNLFRQRIPITIEIASPQSRMDLKVSLIQDVEEPTQTVVDEATAQEIGAGKPPTEGKRGRKPSADQ